MRTQRVIDGVQVCMGLYGYAIVSTNATHSDLQRLSLNRDPVVHRILTLLKQKALSKVTAYDLIQVCASQPPPTAGAQVEADRSVAIIGLACRMPSAKSPEEFW